MNAPGGLTATGFAAPPHIDRLLQDAARVYHDTGAAERILQETLALHPQCLAAHFSLYKFYFYKHRLPDAENIARRALETAARLGGFSADWSQLTPQSVDWTRVEAPQHFYLFTLKALAFIRLRLGHTGEARGLLAKIAVLDPRDSVGADVIRALVAGSTAHSEMVS